MLIAYATAEGELASDVGVGAGPYSSVLAEEIVKPGVEAVTMFRNVQRRVRAAIKQEPYLGFNALGDVYLAGLVPDPSKAAAPPPSTARLSEAAEAWASIKDSNDIRDLEAYRRQYRQSNAFYDRQAERRIEELKNQTAAAAPPAAPPKPLLAPLVDTAVGLLLPSRAPGPLTAAEERALKPKDSFRECDACPEMVVVPAGEFMMGSPEGEEGRNSDEGPQRKVTIARPFAVGKYEVTFAEWDACVAAGGCKHNPSDQGWGRGKRPVINVSWDDIRQQYLPWLSRKTGKTYRLPTEPEWEYVARAGSTTRFHFGNDEKDLCSYGNVSDLTAKEKFKDFPIANCRDGHLYTAPVGSFRPNAFGLYDVHGNMVEWVQDCYKDGYGGAPADGSAVPEEKGCSRVLRGGSWLDDPQRLRSAARRGKQIIAFFIGFRLARTLD